MSLDIVYSPEHDTYGTVPAGKPLPQGWHVVATAPNNRAALKWVAVERRALAMMAGHLTGGAK